MKRLLFIITVFLAVVTLSIPVQAKSQTWTLYLYKDMTTGITTVASGSSTMVVEGGNGKYQRANDQTIITGLDSIEGSTWVVQIDDITCSSGVSAAGNWSGSTFTLRYKESLYDNANHLAKAQTVDAFTGTALSGASRVQVEIYPVALGCMQWEFVTGVSTFSGATVTFKAFDEK